MDLVMSREAKWLAQGCTANHAGGLRRECPPYFQPLPGKGPLCTIPAPLKVCLCLPGGPAVWAMGRWGKSGHVRREPLKVVKIKDTDFRVTFWKCGERKLCHPMRCVQHRVAQKRRNFQHDCLFLYTQTSNVPGPLLTQGCSTFPPSHC